MTIITVAHRHWVSQLTDGTWCGRGWVNTAAGGAVVTLATLASGVGIAIAFTVVATSAGGTFRLDTATRHIEESTWGTSGSSGHAARHAVEAFWTHIACKDYMVKDYVKTFLYGTTRKWFCLGS